MNHREPKHPGALATDAELCEFWRASDSYWATPRNSPLHHDYRCELHAVTPGNPYGFIGPTMPPSADMDKRDNYWELCRNQATWYMWGLSDAGQKRDTNDVFRFGTLYADAYWEYNNNYRGSMRSMMDAVAAFDAGIRI